jgi:hypothetical protein
VSLKLSQDWKVADVAGGWEELLSHRFPDLQRPLHVNFNIGLIKRRRRLINTTHSFELRIFGMYF